MNAAGVQLRCVRQEHVALRIGHGKLEIVVLWVRIVQGTKLEDRVSLVAMENVLKRKKIGPAFITVLTNVAGVRQQCVALELVAQRNGPEKKETNVSLAQIARVTKLAKEDLHVVKANVKKRRKIGLEYGIVRTSVKSVLAVETVPKPEVVNTFLISKMVLY
eukprot:m.49771 g.49771  ORF g.49771 m.49771 type:complete len:162 (-) comp10629_c0_seq2:289-774(-)